jgi:hypothetical protein
MNNSANASPVKRLRLPEGMVLSIKSRRMSGVSSDSPEVARIIASMAMIKPL